MPDDREPGAGEPSPGAVDERAPGTADESSHRGGPKPVLYRGQPLDPAKGPGLGCFWLQIVVLATFIVLTPLSVAWEWPLWISVALLFIVIALLLVAGQTIIFLLRLVAADRREERDRGRRRPLASETPTVGELEDRGGSDDGAGADGAGADGAGTDGAGTDGVRE